MIIMMMMMIMMMTDNDNDITMYNTFQDENSKKEFVTSGHTVFKLNTIPFN
jgi:hypothetical protein